VLTQHPDHGRRQIGLLHQHDVIQELAGELHRDRARLNLTGQALGQGGQLRQGGALQPVVHGRGRPRTDTEQMGARSEPAQGQAHACRQPATPHRDQHLRHVGQGRDDLQPNRPLPGDHGGVIVRGDIDQAALLGQRPRSRLGLLIAGPFQEHLGAIGPRRFDLDLGRPLGHDDQRIDAEQAGAIGHALGMVAR